MEDPYVAANRQSAQAFERENRRDTPSPAAIARRLSPAQRRALMWLPADGCSRPLGTKPPSMQAREFLRAMELMEAPTPSIRRASALGLLVRAELERMEGGDHG